MCPNNLSPPECSMCIDVTMEAHVQAHASPELGNVPGCAIPSTNMLRSYHCK